MSTENKVTLYIATHNITGKKYFGKTTRYFTEQDLQENYHGSGTYWLNHLKKHGDNITMEVYGIYSLEENDVDYVKPIAIKFSEDNNIVEDYDNWANQIVENGLDGGSVKGKTWHLSLETKQKMSKAKTGVIMSKETKEKIGKVHKGKIISKETRNKLSEANIGKIFSEETRNKMSKSRTGVPRSKETKEKIANALAGVSIGPQKIVTCPHCSKKGGISNMKRWHFDKCKELTIKL